MGVSVLEFSKIRGISNTRANQLKKVGLLVLDVDGKVNVEATNAVLDARAKDYRTGRHPKASKTDIEQRAEQLAASRPMLTHAEAVTKKENYLAALRELEYDEAAGRVIQIDVVARQVATEYAAVRSRIMAVPSKVAPRAAMITDAEELRALIEAEIVEVLAELSYDSQWKPADQQ